MKGGAFLGVFIQGGRGTSVPIPWNTTMLNFQ